MGTTTAATMVPNREKEKPLRRVACLNENFYPILRPFKEVWARCEVQAKHLREAGVQEVSVQIKHQAHMTSYHAHHIISRTQRREIDMLLQGSKPQPASALFGYSMGQQAD